MNGKITHFIEVVSIEIKYLCCFPLFTLCVEVERPLFTGRHAHYGGGAEKQGPDDVQLELQPQPRPLLEPEYWQQQQQQQQHQHHRPVRAQYPGPGPHRGAAARPLQGEEGSGCQGQAGIRSGAALILYTLRYQIKVKSTTTGLKTSCTKCS